MAHGSPPRRRRSIRLPGYDYRRCGAYFVTICTHARETWLSEIREGAITLSAYGRVLSECWRALPRHFPGIQLGPMVVMPNHIHGIIYIVDAYRGKPSAARRDVGAKHPPANDCFCGGAMPAGALPLQGAADPLPSPTPPDPPPRPGALAGSLPAIVQNLKSVAARKINRLRGTPGALVWQRNYYEHIIRSEAEAQRIARYIESNPVRWGMDRENLARPTR